MENLKNDDDRRLCRLLNGHITRKTLKQTVMTTVYGVTEYGAKKQISKWLVDAIDGRAFDHLSNEDKKWLRDNSLKAAIYLATKTLYKYFFMFF